MSYSYYPVRRHIDRRVFAVRHNDGVKDLVLKLKNKCKESIQLFKRLPTGAKIIKVLAKVVTIASGIFAAHSAIELKSDLAQLNNAKKALEFWASDPVAGDDLRYQRAMRKSWNEEKNGPLPGKNSAAENAALGVAGDFLPLVTKAQATLKIIVGIIGVIIGTVTDTMVSKQ